MAVFKAYTLLELLIVIVIIGMVSGLTIGVAVRRFSGSSSDYWSRQLAIGIQQARNLAMKEQGVSIQLNEQGWETTGDNSTSLLPERWIAGGEAHISWYLWSGDPVAEWALSRRGYGLDLIAEIRFPSGKGRWRISGFTGECVLLDPIP